MIENITEDSSVDKSEVILLENYDYQQENINKILHPEEWPASLIKCVFDCSSEETKSCLKCHRNYCILHSSRISSNFCQDCFKNLSLIVDKFERRVEDYDSVTDTVTTKKESCKRLKFDGPDWIFYTAWIDKLTDDELQTVWEFHFFVLKLIEQQNEIRGAKRRDQLKSKSTQFMSGVQVTTTKETRTRKEVKPKDPLIELKKIFPNKSEDFYKQMMAVMKP